MAALSVARFIGLLLGLMWLGLYKPVYTAVVMPWTMMVAAAAGHLVSLLDAGVVVSGATLLAPASGFAITIESGCNGVEATLVLLAALLGFPLAWRARALGLLVGFTTVQLLNIGRIVSLYFLGKWDADAFRWAHLYIWPTLIMLDVLVIWLLLGQMGRRPVASV